MRQVVQSADHMAEQSVYTSLWSCYNSRVHLLHESVFADRDRLTILVDPGMTEGLMRSDVDLVHEGCQWSVVCKIEVAHWFRAPELPEWRRVSHPSSMTSPVLEMMLWALPPIRPWENTKSPSGKIEINLLFLRRWWRRIRKTSAVSQRRFRQLLLRWRRRDAALGSDGAESWSL